MQGLNWGENGPRKTRKGRWSAAEVARLKDMYGLREDEAIARELQRSPSSVRKMAETLFRTAERTGPWTAGDVENLKRYLGATTPEVIARILGRTAVEVQEKIFELGRVRGTDHWRREEVARFKRIYGARSDEDLAKIFSKSIESVERLAKHHRLAKDKAFLKKLNGQGTTRMPRWTAEELETLRELYATTANLEIADRLNRSVKSIVSKAHHIGLKKDLDRLRQMGRENVSLRYGDSDSSASAGSSDTLGPVGPPLSPPLSSSGDGD